MAAGNARHVGKEDVGEKSKENPDTCGRGDAAEIGGAARQAGNEGQKAPEPEQAGDGDGEGFQERGGEAERSIIEMQMGLFGEEDGPGVEGRQEAEDSNGRDPTAPGSLFEQ